MNLRSSFSPTAPVLSPQPPAGWLDDVEPLRREIAVAFLTQAPALRRDLARTARESAAAFQNQLVRLRGALQLVAAERALDALSAAEHAFLMRRVSRLDIVTLAERELDTVEHALVLAYGPLSTPSEAA